MRAPAFQACTSTIGALAVIILYRVRLGPHIDVFKHNIVTWSSIRTDDSDGTTSRAVRAGPLPVAECNVMIQNTVSSGLGLRGLIAVEIETVCIFVSNEVLEGNIINRTAAAVGLEHEHLVGIYRVNIVVCDVMNICTGMYE